LVAVAVQVVTAVQPQEPLEDPVAVDLGDITAASALAQRRCNQPVPVVDLVMTADPETQIHRRVRLTGMPVGVVAQAQLE
jgi:hypothetical protein